MNRTFSSRRVLAGAAAVACGALLSGLPPAAEGAKAKKPKPEPELSWVTGSQGFTGGHSVVEGKRLYVGAYGLGMRIFDISDPAAPAQIGQVVPGGSRTDAGVARADAVPDAIDVGDRKFAVLNGTSRVGGHDRVRTQRSEFFDVTNAAAPKLLAHFIGATDGEAHNGDIVDKRRLWVASGGSGHNGLRIYDLSPTLTADAATCAPADGVSDKTDGTGNPCAPVKLYGSKLPAGSDVVGEGNPVKLWETSPYRRGRPVGAAFEHTHDVEIYTGVKVAGFDTRRDIALLAEGGRYIDNAGDTGSTFVIDITNPRKPVVLLRWLHEKSTEQKKHHPIRYHHEAQLLDGDRSVMLVTDEDLHNGCGGAGGIVAMRLSADFTEATELSEWFIPLGTPAPVCSVHVMSSKGDHLFTGSYNAGLQVVDYSNPAEPKQAAEHMAPGTTAWGALYHKGYVYVGDMTRGLDVYRWSRKPAAARTARPAQSPMRGLLPDSSLGRMPVHFHHAHAH